MLQQGLPTVLDGGASSVELRRGGGGGGAMEEEGRRQPAQVLSLHMCFPVPAMESREDKEDWKSAEDGKREDKNDATLLLGGERNTNK